MTIRRVFSAGLFALALGFAPISTAIAQNLTIMRGEAQAPLKVPLNRAVVLESDSVFAELSVANPLIADIATLSDRTIYVLGKAPGRTTMTLLGLDGRLITNVEVQVTPDVGELKERLSELLPGERISVRTANDGIVLSGTVSSATRVQRAMEIANRYAPDAVLNLLSVGGSQQVQLKVRFAEMSRSVSKELAASISANGSLLGGDLTVGATQSRGTTGTAQGALSLGFSAGGLQFTALIQALEQKGIVRTLAEPNLTAISGKTATFLAGGEVPIPVADGEGGVSASYRNFGVELSFTPTVVDSDVININLRSKVSSIDASQTVTIEDAEVTGFRTRETSTTIEMRDGQSFAIAGLLQDDFQDTAGQVPWLGDIPILGALFRSASYQRAQSELVIIITAHLVTPTNGDALALPTDRIRPPTERELFLFGELGVSTSDGPRVSSQSGANDVAGQDFTGSYGYVLE